MWHPDVEARHRHAVSLHPPHSARMLLCGRRDIPGPWPHTRCARIANFTERLLLNAMRRTGGSSNGSGSSGGGGHQLLA